MDLSKLKGQLQTEVDTAFLYESIASIQSDENLGRVLQSLAEIERGHAKHMLNKVKEVETNHNMPLPSSRAKFQLKLGKLFGYSSIIYPSLTARQFGIIMLLVFSTALFSALFPARKALQLNPAESLKK